MGCGKVNKLLGPYIFNNLETKKKFKHVIIDIDNIVGTFIDKAKIDMIHEHYIQTLRIFNIDFVQQTIYLVEHTYKYIVNYINDIIKLYNVKNIYYVADSSSKKFKIDAEIFNIFDAEEDIETKQVHLKDETLKIRREKNEKTKQIMNTSMEFYNDVLNLNEILQNNNITEDKFKDIYKNVFGYSDRSLLCVSTRLILYMIINNVNYRIKMNINDNDENIFNDIIKSLHVSENVKQEYYLSKSEGDIELKNIAKNISLMNNEEDILILSNDSDFKILFTDMGNIYLKYYLTCTNNVNTNNTNTNNNQVNANKNQNINKANSVFNVQRVWKAFLKPIYNIIDINNLFEYSIRISAILGNDYTANINRYLKIDNNNKFNAFFRLIHKNDNDFENVETNIGYKRNNNENSKRNNNNKNKLSYIELDGFIKENNAELYKKYIYSIVTYNNFELFNDYETLNYCYFNVYEEMQRRIKKHYIKNKHNIYSIMLNKTQEKTEFETVEERAEYVRNLKIYYLNELIKNSKSLTEY